jgi:signal transduction histidine kinase/DNA-binding response OmpR family regulator
MNARANILIVDDRPDKLLVMQAILEELGQSLYTVRSGEEALREILKRDFALILLDVNMPGLDGLETAALIRRRKRSAHIPIIFITADYADELRTSKGYSLGAVDYITSPIVPEVLRAKAKVFVDLFLLAEQAKLQSQQRIALAEEKAARRAAEQATRRLAFLAEATTTLAESLDIAAGTRELTRLVVPTIADVALLELWEDDVPRHGHVAWRAGSGTGDAASHGAFAEHLHVHAGDGSLAPAAPVADAAGASPARGAPAPGTPAADGTQATITCSATAGSRAGVPDWLAHAMSACVRSARAELVSPPRSSTAAGAGGSATPGEAGGDMPVEAQDSLACLHEAYCVPLAARGRTLGVLTLCMVDPQRRFDADRLATVTDLASRAAISLDNALLYRKIQDEDRRKNEFLAMLAHELRNPLAPISNAVHLLNTQEQDPGRLKWARDVIARQLKQLVRLVDDLLDVSRITRGKIELKDEVLDAAAVIAAAVETSRPNVDQLEHTLTTLVPPQPLRLHGDFARVSQVLANLINNAAKYTPRGGRIAVTAEREGDNVVFRVRDSGVGIPHEYLRTIFEPFTQVDQTLDRSQGGLGIGLTLVRSLVEMQGGSVEAFSAGRDQGSELVVRLPAVGDDAIGPIRVDASARVEASAAGLRVLVVDDNRDVADTTATILRLSGCDTHVAYDGAAGIEAVERLHPDAVLLDIGLPGLDGYQVAERMRRHPAHRRTLVVAVSGYGQEEDRARSMAAGFDYHVVKPIDPVVITGLLASLREGQVPGALPENVVHFPTRRAAE